MSDDLTHYMEATERMRQRAELAEAQRDHLQDDLASVAMAVAGDRTGVIEQDDIVDLVREVVAERDAHADEIEFYRERMNELIAERDRLRAVVDDPAGPVAKTMEYLGQVEAERDRLRTSAELANNAADAAGEAVGTMAAKLSDVLAERDRLRAVVDAANDYMGSMLGPERAGDPRKWEALEMALAALDGSGDMGDG